MAQNSDKISVSFPIDELKAIDARVKELGLPAHGGRSQYFQMLRELDKKTKLQVYPHAKDRSWHFFPEENEALAAEQQQALYEAAKKKKS
jgi:Na+-transporting NADH:ubiquinone oxidoreductase subunit NqrF